MNDIFSFDYVPNYVPSKNEGYKKGDTERAVYYYEGDKECNEKHKGFYMYFDESEIYKYTGECKKLDNISTDDLYNELCVRMSEQDEIVVLLSVDKYKSLLDFERERKEFEEYKKAEMEKLVREKEREKREFEEYKKAEMEKEMEKLSIELKKEKETFVNDVSLELYKYENRPAERIPEEILKRIVNDIDLYVTVPSTDELYPVLYFKSHIQSPGCPTNLYLHTFYYNTGARLDINERRNTNYHEVNQLGHSSRSPPYLPDLYGQKVIDSLKQYKDKYIFTQNMVDIIYKTFDGKEKFIINNHRIRWSEYDPIENNVDRLVNALKQERDEYILNLRTLV